MTSPDAPPALKPPAYTLPSYVWLVWLPCAALVGWLAYRKTGADSSYNTGYIIGSVVGTLFLPMIVSWITWRISGRKGRTHVVMFLVLVGFVVLGQVNQWLSQAGERAAHARFAEESKKTQSDMRALLTSDKGMAPEQAVKVLNQAKNSLKALEESTQGDARGEAVAGQAFLAYAQSAQHRHLAAITGLHMDTFFEMESVADAPLRAARREALVEFRAACADLRTFLETGAAFFEKELRKQNVSALGIRQSLAGFHESATPRRAFLLGIREKDEALAQALDDFLQFAEKFEGRWARAPQGNQLQFTDDDAVKEYNDLMALVGRLSREQTALQQQLGLVGTK